MVKNIKSLFLNISLTILVVLLFLTIFEMILRQTFVLTREYNDEFFKKDIQEGDTPYEPNASVVFEGTGDIRLKPTVVSFNSQGLRDYEYSIEKPNNTFRILGFGDSSTWGHGVELNETYLKQLEKKLNSVHNDLRYEVINFGVGGYNTMRSVELLKMKGLNYIPDIVILLGSSNDVKLYSPIKIPESKPFLKNFYITEWIEASFYHNYKIKKDISEIKKNPDELWKLIGNPLTELSQMAGKNNFTVILLIQPHTFSDEYKQFIVKYNFSTTSFPEQNNVNKDELSLEDGHPSPFCHELIANNLYKTLVDDNLTPLYRKQDTYS